MSGARFEGELPGRWPLDAYGAGGFRFGDMSHRGSVLCLPSAMRAWAPRLPAEVTPESLDALLAERERIEFVLFGTGRDPAPVPAAALAALRGAGLRVDAMATGPAARTYNVVLAEGRRVAAALLAVD